MKTNLVIVRDYVTGVMIGYVEDFDKERRSITLSQCRAMRRWRGANTLYEAAAHGVAEEHTRISEPAPGLVTICPLNGEVIDVAPEAEANLTRSRWAP